ncbi:MAG TPA: arginine--tRNA ligase [Candidatus Dormibacteraeota bacterium]|nr:arginine--tRNA ligase [Candidatus Dormibacteraeota bacterium]
MYQTLTNRLREALARHIREKYGVELRVALERPPKIEMGEAASPVSFELAKRLKRAPRQIAQEIANSLGPVEGIARVEVAGAGYLNVYFDRGAFWVNAQQEAAGSVAKHKPEKIIVEHTSINPNKAAHIGHVRNAALGDSMARVLRHAGYAIQVQNYIDNTGVQVADVVVGFLHMEKKSAAEVRALAGQPKFDYLCWDLYAHVTHYFEEDKARAAALRGETLKAIEEGRGEAAEAGTTIADAIVGFHLRTMARLDISYDLLARESEILHLKFWDAAFEKLKASGAIQYVTSGKMAGCWIMPWKERGEEKKEAGPDGESPSDEEDPNRQDDPSTQNDANMQDKIIVRSNGTVTYVGKDIAYQLWKFGLLGKDFHYAKWPHAPRGRTLWTTTSGPSDPAAPNFGAPASRVYNVIDSRQAYLQEVVAEGLRRLGHTKEAEQSIHFAYEIVALTPRCAAEMGYALSPEEAKKPYVEVSGRKGFGVKADDLLDKLEGATLAQVQQRHAEMPPEVQKQTAHAIAAGALRFFLLKFTRNAVIAFDFNDALSFEGETGPYCQYAVVRIRGIRRKGAEEGATRANVTREKVAALLSGPEGNGLWELVVLAGSLDYAVDAAIGGQEPAFVAKFAFQLAQAFNLFYHKHHILSEADEEKRAFLLRLTELVEAQLVHALDLLGMEAPEKM